MVNNYKKKEKLNRRRIYSCPIIYPYSSSIFSLFRPVHARTVNYLMGLFFSSPVGRRTCKKNDRCRSNTLSFCTATYYILFWGGLCGRNADHTLGISPVTPPQEKKINSPKNHEETKCFQLSDKRPHRSCFRLAVMTQSLSTLCSFVPIAGQQRWPCSGIHVIGDFPPSNCSETPKIVCLLISMAYYFLKMNLYTNSKENVRLFIIHRDPLAVK